MKRERDEQLSGALSLEFRHAIEKLEFGSVLDMLASNAVGERTAAVLKGTGMLGTDELVERRQSMIREGLGLLERGEDLPVTGWKDSTSVLESINAEGVAIDSRELGIVAEGEITAGRIRGFLEKHSDDIPLLFGLADLLRPQEEVVRLIGSAIGEEGEIVDGASKELKRIRKALGALREKLRRAFADYAQRKGGGREYEFVTMRGERYVVSLPRSEAAGIKGIVHQSSASGASLYVEPLEFVEENNRLESLVQDEKREIERILRELTAAVYRVKDDLLSNQRVILDIDAIRAKALFARRFECTKPIHSEKGLLRLRGARHPLLEKRLAEQEGEVRPLDLELSPEQRALVISGPNAGGKTVALKTIGLVVLMDRTGLLVPCKEDSILPGYRHLFVDIGDDQSIEMSLSTFSSRIVRMKSILDHVDDASLVLIDEIGDGTDPEEGAALAEALLERLMPRSGRTIVTTHLSPLKGWAHEREGAVNATLEFDPERLRDEAGGSRRRGAWACRTRSFELRGSVSERSRCASRSCWRT